MKISSLMTTFGALILISGTLASKNIPTKFNFLSAAVKSRSDIVVRRQDTAECTADSEEYDRRLKAVLCDEDYIKAVRSGIERSTCKSNYYTEDDIDESDLDCDPIVDSRANVSDCTSNCSTRVSNYYYCTYLWEDVIDLNRECGVETNEYCAFDKGDFCFLLYINLSIPVFEACTGDMEECNETCKDAVEQFKDESGCCGAWFLGPDNYYGSGAGDDEKLTKIFTTCGVDVPSQQCTSYTPPQEFLECAGIEPVEPTGAAAITTPFYIATMVLTVVGLLAK